MYRILNARIAVLFCVLFVFLASVRANEGTNVIGTVASIQESTVVMQNALSQILKAGSDLQLDDVISTEKNPGLRFLRAMAQT